MPVNLKEIEGDIFSAPKEYALGHCVAADLCMGRGIACQFKERFCGINELRRQNVRPGGVGVIQYSGRYIYYLVTKERSYSYPTYPELVKSLEAMRNHMRNNGVKRLALPRIGCGIDRLIWNKVKQLLLEVFVSEDVEIVIYTYKPS